MPRKGEEAQLDDRTRMLHMLEAARQALSFVAGRQRSDLDTDHMLRRATKDCIQEIGEAAAKVSDESRARAPNLPWTKMVGMRHILVHVYFDLDNDAIWKVTQEHLPLMVTELEAALDTWPAA